MRCAVLVALVLGGIGWTQESAPESRRSDVPPGMVLVPGGKYRIGMEFHEIETLAKQPGIKATEAEALELSEPSHLVELEDFYVDVNEVTNKWWAAFLRDTQRAPPKRWRGEKDAENLPVTNVTYDDAELFLAWCGRRFLTEFEWEAAARYRRPGDPAKGWWPWGDTYDAEAVRSPSGERHQLAPVGSFPRGASALGINDLAGNALEMTSSTFLRYPGNRSRNRAFSASLYVLRGGGTLSPAIGTTTTMRHMMTVKSAELIGFRGARSKSRERDLFASIMDRAVVFLYLEDAGRPRRDERLGKPELALRDPTRCAVLVAGGWDPVLQVPSHARFVGVACRNTLSLCDSAAVPRVVGDREALTMIACFHADVDLVKPRLPAGAYWVSWDPHRVSTPEDMGGVVFQSILDSKDRHRVPLSDLGRDATKRTTLEVGESGRALSVLLSFPCQDPGAPRLNLSFRLEAAEGALAPYR